MYESVGYDAAGNMIRDKDVGDDGWMTYDGDDKMVWHNAGNTTNDPTVYLYDTYGKRNETAGDHSGTRKYIRGLFWNIFESCRVAYKRKEVKILLSYLSTS